MTNETHEYAAEIIEALGLEPDHDCSEYHVYEGKLSDYAFELADELGWLDAMRKAGMNDGYFDADQFAYDMMLGGDVVPLFKMGMNRRDDMRWSAGLWLTNPNG